MKQMKDVINGEDPNPSYGGYTFLQNIKLSSLEELTNCIGGGFERVYINYSNLIYVVIIFLKLKIY